DARGTVRLHARRSKPTDPTYRADDSYDRKYERTARSGGSPAWLGAARFLSNLRTAVPWAYNLTSVNAWASTSISAFVLNGPGLTRTVPSGNVPIDLWMYGAQCRPGRMAMSKEWSRMPPSSVAGSASLRKLSVPTRFVWSRWPNTW